MNELILCEGKTDAILLGYYMSKSMGWMFRKKGPNGLHIECEKKNDQNTAWYQKEGRYLLIASVGGHTRFGDFFDNYIKRPIVDGNSFQKIVIVTDADGESIPDTESFINEQFTSLSDFRNGKWTQQQYCDGFAKEQVFQSFLLVIPINKQGALETVLLDALSGMSKSNNIIVSESKNFVYKMRNGAGREYIKSDRLELKSQLNVTFAIISPQKVFDYIEDLIRSVDWENSEIIRSCFYELGTL